MSILSMRATRVQTDRPLRWKQMKRRLRERWQLAQLCYECENLSDESLRDIGLLRAEADFEASKAFRID